MELAWKDVLKREDIVGGDLKQFNSVNGYLQGPIEKIELLGNFIEITRSWAARLSRQAMVRKPRVWKSFHDMPFTITVCSKDSLFSPADGRLCFFLGADFCEIYPKGIKDESKLDPSKVEGLVLPPK